MVALAVSIVAVSSSVCVAAGTTAPGRAPRPGSLAAYLELVAHYRWSLSSGAPAAATIVEMLSWRDQHMASAVGKLIKRLNGSEQSRMALCDVWMNAQSDAMIATGHLPVPLSECDLTALLRSGIALHTLAAARSLDQREMRRGIQELASAHSLIGELPSSASEFSRRARLTCGYLAQSHQLLGVALSFIQELQGGSLADPETLLALGAAYESYALTCVTDDGKVLSNDGCGRLRQRRAPGRDAIPTSRDGCLALAEANLRRARPLAPALTSVRLRLGHVLAVMGRAEAAGELETVVATSTDAGERSLASLFLARLEERAGRQDEALEHARAAARDAPGSQTARAALARALFMAGEREGAAQEAKGAVTSQPQPFDYYLIYRLGTPWFFGLAFNKLRSDVW